MTLNAWLSVVGFAALLIFYLIFRRIENGKHRHQLELIRKRLRQRENKQDNTQE